MKTSRLSIAGYIVGAAVIVASTIRWFFLWPDFSQFILATAMGCLIIVMAYIYNWMRLKEDQLRKMEKRLDSIVAWWMGLEKDEVINQARGKGDES